MSSTILLLLGILGATTYYEIRHHMRVFGEASLRGEVSEPKFAVEALTKRREMEQLHVGDSDADEAGSEAGSRGRSGEKGAGNRPISDLSADAAPQVLSLADDSGQDVYFVAVNSTHQVVLHTSEMPVSAAALESGAKPSGFTVLNYHLRPFRVYAFPYIKDGFDGTIYIYQMIIGEVRTLKDVAAILWTIGGVGGFLVVLLNFWLARRALHPARETWRAQQEMLLELSHELRTPLATIATIASGDVSSGDVRSGDVPSGKIGLGPGIGRRLVRETEHATALINDILYFAQLRSALDQKVEPVAVSDVTDDTVLRFHPLAQARGMVLRGEAQSGIYVTCTIERWTHLVSILLKNATQHGREGTEIRWSLTSTRDAVKFVVENEVDKSPATRGFRGPAGANGESGAAGAGAGGSGGSTGSTGLVKAKAGSFAELRGQGKKMGTQHDMNLTGIGLRIAHRLVKDMRGRLTQTRLQDRMITEVTVPRVSRWSV